VAGENVLLENHLKETLDIYNRDFTKIQTSDCKLDGRTIVPSQVDLAGI
jgi:hypothetical protein